MVRCSFYGKEITVPGFEDTTPEGVNPPVSVLTTFDSPTGVAPDLRQQCDAGVFTTNYVAPAPEVLHQTKKRRCLRCAAYVDHSSAPLPNARRRP